jgi:hypothetical protein
VSDIWPYLAAIIPSVGVGILFYVVIKNMIEGDRKERLAHSQWEAAEKELAKQRERSEEKSASEARKKQDGNS